MGKAEESITKESRAPEGNWSRLIKWSLVVGAGLAIWLAPTPAGITPQSWRLLAIFIATIVGSIARPVPSGAMVLLGVTAVAITRSMPLSEAAIRTVTDPAKPDWKAVETLRLKATLGGYADPVVWLVLAAFFMSTGMIKTGLGRRIALLFIRAIGHRSLGLGYALVATDFLMASVIPSNGARTGGITFPITKSIAEAYDSKPGPTAALGQLKIDMPNDHAIFLHDTPNKTLFANNPRAYSHGCLRTERAFELGILLSLIQSGEPLNDVAVREKIAEDLVTLIRAGKTTKAAGGGVEDALVLDGYTTCIAKRLSLKRPLRIVVDGGNGMIGTLFQHLAPKLPGVAIVPMLFDPDGRFPHHDANPLKAENLKQIQARVVAEQADFAAAFDGDGDRCALVDGQGRIVSCDLTTALLASHYLQQEPGAAVAYDLRSSKVVPEMIRAWGGKPVETRVGHSFIKQTLKETGAVLAGELSGHYYFRDFYGADSGLFAFVLLANVVSRARSLAELVEPLRRYHHSGEINFTAEKDAAFARVRALPGAELQELDGITVRYRDWWANVRASNTEPVVRLNLEADTAALMQAKVAELGALIRGT